MKKQIQPQDNRDLPTHIIVLTVLCFLLGMLLIFLPEKEAEIVFIPPPFAEDAAQGSPQVRPEWGYAEITRPGMPFSAWLCGAPPEENGALRLCFTNPADSWVWLRLRLFDEAGQLVSETGILRPGEYLEWIPLNEGSEAGPLTAEIMSYQPETYYSQGAVRVNIKGTAAH